MKTLDLAGVWARLQCESGEIVEGLVPGSFMLDLLRAGKMENPFYRDREERMADAYARQTYLYSREFTVDSELMDCAAVFLVCEGLDTLADVRINGQLVASTDNMHRRYEWNVRHHLVAGRNEISVLLRSPLPLMEERENADPLWGAAEAIAGFTHIRKGHFMFGWDWGPQIPDAGIWRPIYLQGVKGARIADVQVTQRHEDKQVMLAVRVQVDVFGEEFAAAQVRITVTAPSGDHIAHSVKAESGEIRHTIIVAQPQLWWPTGYGDQPLYDFKVELLANSAVIDERSLRLGLRTIQLRREADQWGESFEFVVNGIPIFIRGANYIPEDNLLSRCSRERTERLLRDAQAANFNALRVWGGGIYPEDYFYDLCDKFGLLVWQDFMFACGVYRLTPTFEATVRQEAADNIRRIRHHASLCLWCGNNEMETAWVDWNIPKPDDLRADYLRLFEEILPAIVAEQDPQTPYWPSSPSSGGGFVVPNDQHRGDVHYWEVWHALKPFTEYRKYHFRFCSEFGFQSFPGDKTVREFTLPEDRNIFSYVMERHQKNGDANGKILYYLAQNFKYPRDFSAVLYASQILQAEAIRYGVEHWRRNRGRCMGSIYWQLNDCWPVASWSSIDSAGRWKALHYFAKRFYSPVLLSAQEDGTTVTLCVTNDTRETVRGEVVWHLRDEYSRVQTCGQQSVTVSALTVEQLSALDFAGPLTTGRARRSTYLDYALRVDGEFISGGTVLFVPTKHFTFVPPKIAVAVTETPDHFSLAITSQAFAKFVELDLSADDARFSDNYFDVSAGAITTITVAKTTLSTVLTWAEFRNQLRVRSVYDLEAIVDA